MRVLAGALGVTTLYIILIVALIVGATVFGLWMNGWALPWQAHIERVTVKQSESFTNSSNLAIQGMIDNYNALQRDAVTTPANAQADQALELSIMNHICMQISTMNADTVAPSNLAFVQAHGGCH